MKKIDLTDMELTKEVDGLKFYEHYDNDQIIILNPKGEFIAEITASCSMNTGFLDLETK
jgi:hypothetical protein